MRASIESVKANPVSAILVCTIVATFVYFFGVVPLFADHLFSAFGWAWIAWNPETNYEHAKLIPLIVVGLLWYDRKKISTAEIGSSAWGWVFLAAGLLLFLVSARTVQARFALAALPCILFGAVLYVWGKAVARIVLFPIALMLSPP